MALKLKQETSISEMKARSCFLFFESSHPSCFYHYRMHTRVWDYCPTCRLAKTQSYPIPWVSLLQMILLVWISSLGVIWCPSMVSVTTNFMASNVVNHARRRTDSSTLSEPFSDRILFFNLCWNYLCFEARHGAT